MRPREFLCFVSLVVGLLYILRVMDFGNAVVLMLVIISVAINLR